MNRIHFLRETRKIDWDALKTRLSEDSFDNGRSAAQLRLSFEHCATCVFAVSAEDGSVIGKARALSDGVCNGYIVDVWTYTPFRRRGIASEMVRLLLADLDGQHVYLDSDEEKVGFYERLGFEKQRWGMGRVVGEWLENGSRAPSSEP